MGELWGVSGCCEDLGENWPCYNGTTLYNTESDYIFSKQFSTFKVSYLFELVQYCVCTIILFFVIFHLLQPTLLSIQCAWCLAPSTLNKLKSWVPEMILPAMYPTCSMISIRSFFSLIFPFFLVRFIFLLLYHNDAAIPSRMNIILHFRDIGD